MELEVDQKRIALHRMNSTAYKVTMVLYTEKKATIGRDRSRDNLTLGFSTGRIVRTCSVDYVADVKNVAMKALGFSSALNRDYMRTVLQGKDPVEVWLGRHASARQLQDIEKRVQQVVGAAFIRDGIHPFALYNKPVDVR